MTDLPPRGTLLFQNQRSRKPTSHKVGTRQVRLHVYCPSLSHPLSLFYCCSQLLILRHVTAGSRLVSLHANCEFRRLHSPATLGESVIGNWLDWLNTPHLYSIGSTADRVARVVSSVRIHIYSLYQKSSTATDTLSVAVGSEGSRRWRHQWVVGS